MKKVAIFLLMLSVLYAEKRYGVATLNGGSALKESIVTLLLSVIMFLAPLIIALFSIMIRFKKIAKSHFENERNRIEQEIAHFLTHDVITIEIDQESIELQKEIEKTKKELRRLS